MRDTAPDVERKFRELLLARSGEERLRMGCSMHNTAKALVRASVLAREPDASPAVIRRELFLRFYGQELHADVRRRILEALSEAKNASKAASLADDVAGVRSPDAGRCG